MPNARAHDIITLVTGAALTPLSYGALLSQSKSPDASALDTALLVGAHLLSGIMFSPDLDIDSAIDNRWGFFYWIWRPYMWAVPHRSRWLSHGLVVPPLLRLLYFFVVVTLLFLGVAWILGRVGITVPDYPMRAIGFLLALIRTNPREVLAFVIGFMTGGAAHSIADWLVTGGKHVLHRLGIHVKKDYADHDRRRRRVREDGERMRDQGSGIRD